MHGDNNETINHLHTGIPRGECARARTLTRVVILIGSISSHKEQYFTSE